MLQPPEPPDVQVLQSSFAGALAFDPAAEKPTAVSAAIAKRTRAIREFFILNELMFHSRN